MADSILLIGDVIIDEYTYGRKLGISAETPTVVGEFLKKESFVGGCGLVARNLLRLGCQVTMMSTGPSIVDRMLLSSDPPSYPELERFQYVGLGGGRWRHTEKKRYFVDSYKMLQYDVLDRIVWDDRDVSSIMSDIFSALSKRPDSVVISDNRHGCLNKEIACGLISLCQSMGIPVYVDSQVSQSRSNHSWYSGAGNFVINSVERDEILEEMGQQSAQDLYDEDTGISVLKYLGCERLYVKLGARGSVMFRAGAGTMEISSQPPPKEVVDVCGAGDAYLAALVASRGDQFFANRWAGMSVCLPGTRVPSIGVL